MFSALVYLANRSLYRVAIFFRHWYYDSFYLINRAALNILERLDRIFALKINLKLLFRPLYQDYTIPGYLLGFVLRSARVLAGGTIYFFIFIAAIGVYLVWAFIPVLIVFRIWQ